MKIKEKLAIILCATFIFAFFSACGTKKEATPSGTTQVTTAQTTTQIIIPATTLASPVPLVSATPNVDVVTTASIVNTQEAFLKAISKEGTWIIAILNDMTINQDLVLDGQFKNSKGEVERKLAFYAQDAKFVVTKRFTLTAPKLTVISEGARIQGGTFVGDVYVAAKNFLVIDATVQGNIYFASDDFKNTFKIDKGTVTGVQEVKK